MITPAEERAVLAWIALARAYDHAWVKHVPVGARFVSFEALEAAVPNGDIGANRPSLLARSGCRAREGRTGRLFWDVGVEGGECVVNLRVKRRMSSDFPVTVLSASIAYDVDIGGFPDLHLGVLLLSRYHKRHVAELERMLRALGTLPPEDGGLSERSIAIVVAAARAGALR